jgi:hypothetical protein
VSLADVVGVGVEIYLAGGGEGGKGEEEGGVVHGEVCLMRTDSVACHCCQDRERMWSGFYADDSASLRRRHFIPSLLQLNFTTHVLPMAL